MHTMNDTLQCRHEISKLTSYKAVKTITCEVDNSKPAKSMKMDSLKT